MTEQKVESFDNRNVVQIGLVVRDAEKTARAYAEIFGLPMPEIIMTEPEEQAGTRYQGEPTQARAKLAFFEFDNVTVELIEPVGEPSTWQRFLDKRGEGVHHIAFTVEGMDGQIKRLADQGLPLEQQGGWTTDGGGRYAYVDGTSRLGVMLELLESH